MAGLVPAIHAFSAESLARKTWMPATSAGMTAESVLRYECKAPSVATDTVAPIILKTQSRSCVFTAGDFLSAPNFAAEIARPATLC